jgi:integrase/recombinase XerD
MTALAPTLQAFFTERLISQRQVSPHTVAAYRDAFRLLLGFTEDHAGKPASTLDLEDLDAPTIGAFLDHLERDRRNSARTRNARLAAVHSLFRYAALRHPEHAAVIHRVLAIPPKRFDRTVVSFLSPPEVDALLAAPDRTRWVGRRDHALLLLAIQTGLRVSELTALTIHHVQLGSGAHVRCVGKGRKARCTPLTAQTVVVLRAWLHERRGQPTDPLFPTSRGRALSRDAVALLVTRHATTATQGCPTRPSQPRRSPLTCFATPPPCGSCTQAWTPPPSPCGSGMREPRPPRSTSMPTRRSRSERSPEPHPPAPHPGATCPPTACSPSSNSCAEPPIMPRSPSRTPPHPGHPPGHSA